MSADEIIDALFLAFPTLGLSKIIWAVDIILEMDIPEFHQDSLGQKQSWHEVMAIEKLKDKEAVNVHADGRDLFIYFESNEIKVFDSRCPHQATNIPELALDAYTLTCPKHGWKFNVKTGECIEKGDRPLHELESRVVQGQHEVHW